MLLMTQYGVNFVGITPKLTPYYGVCSNIYRQKGLS